MKIIHKDANPSGAYPPMQEGAHTIPEGFVLWPDGLDASVFYEHNGFVILTIGEVDGVDTVTDVQPNTEAREAWKATLPEEPDPVVSARSEKEAELSSACNAVIVAGMDVETTQGTEHFSLQETDQINLTTALSAIQAGAAAYPYHSDGQLCRLFTAEEITAICDASVNHKLYHTTLCNHLLTWARRAETVEELQGIAYSAEGLPEDLAANMANIFTAAAAL